MTLTLEVIVLESQSPHLQLHPEQEGEIRVTSPNTLAYLKFASAVVIAFGLLTAVSAWLPLNLPS